MQTKESKVSKKWYWIIAIILVLYTLGRLSTGSKSEIAKSDSTNVSEFRANSILPLKQIAGKSRNDVEKVIGPGRFEKNWVDKRSGCSKCPKYIYKDGSLEIIYINSKADRITINDLNEYPFKESFIEGLGLNPQKPSFENESVMRWYSYDNFKEIMAFNDGKGNINYALIKTKAD